MEGIDQKTKNKLVKEGILICVVCGPNGKIEKKYVINPVVRDYITGTKGNDHLKEFFTGEFGRKEVPLNRKDDKGADRDGVIYLIRSGKYLKIGYTGNIERRLREYALHNPTSKLLHTFTGSKRLEKKIHLKLKDIHYSGEWFYYSEQVIDRVLKVIGTNPIK